MTEVETPCSRAGCIGLCIGLSIGPLSILTGICCLIASLSTSHWLELYDKNGTLYSHGGLWEICIKDACESWDDSPMVDDTDYAKMTIAALIIACIAYLAGLLIMVVFVLSVLSGEKPSLGGESSWGSSLIFNCTALGTFVKFQNDPVHLFPSVLTTYDYGYSFHLAWICMVTVVVGCGITVLIAIFSNIDPSPGGENAIEPVPAGNEVRTDVYRSESSAEPVGFYRYTDNSKVV